MVDVNTGKFTGSGGNLEETVDQEQPRGGRGDRPPAPAAGHRRHHRHRLHRHGAGVQPRAGAAPADRVPRPGPHQAPGRRGHLARPGADDPQADGHGPARGRSPSRASTATDAACTSTSSRSSPRRESADVSGARRGDGAAAVGAPGEGCRRAGQSQTRNRPTWHRPIPTTRAGASPRWWRTDELDDLEPTGRRARRRSAPDATSGRRPAGEPDARQPTRPRSRSRFDPGSAPRPYPGKPARVAPTSVCARIWRLRALRLFVRRVSPRCTRLSAAAAGSRRSPSVTSSTSTRSRRRGRLVRLPAGSSSGRRRHGDRRTRRRSPSSTSPPRSSAPTKGPKIDILKFKNKTGYRQRQGHRQKYTQVKITGIAAEK